MPINKVKNYLKEYSYLKSFQSLLYWDMETMMPKGAIKDRAERLSYIQGKIHHHLTAKKYHHLLEELANEKLSPIEKKLLKELKWDFHLQHALPASHVKKLARDQALASHVWAEARKNNDWKSFVPHLQNLINLKRNETSFFKAQTPYDALIQFYDKDFSSSEIKKLFNKLKQNLITITNQVKENKNFVQIKDLSGPFSIKKQQALSLYIAKIFGLPEEYSRLDTSVHPFSINISPQDQRITTRYVPHHLDSLGSTMHEVGHALYEYHLPSEWEGTPLAEAISLSVHESQSRFWENIIGRSREFCYFLYPTIKKAFPSAFEGVSKEGLFKIFNKSVPGLIRVESCELYYNQHIIIRFELEEMIFNQGLDAKDLPEMWNKMYQDVLGIKPKNFSEGILQDSHWAGAAFGYFPTYALGNLISGSLYQKMKKEIKSFHKNIEQGDFRSINAYLKSNIHQKGRSVSAKDIVGKLDTDDYLNYLKDKFKEFR